MASSAINLMVFLITIAGCTTKGFRIENTQSNVKLKNFPTESFSIANSNFPVQPFTRQYENVNDGPIAGYPKVPPPNAYESGGLDGDLLPPEGGFTRGQEKRNQFFRRSTNFEKQEVNSKSSFPQFTQTIGKSNGESQQILKPFLGNPLNSKTLQNEKAVDIKAGYSLSAQPHGINAGANGDTVELPLGHAVEKAESNKVDPKTGYPLQAQPHWKSAGGDGDILEVPLEDLPPLKNFQNEEAVDPKTGYPLQPQPQWKDAGGDGDILELPLEDTSLSRNSSNEEAVDPKTGYPLQAQPHWKDAGGDGDILEVPLEDTKLSKNFPNEEAVDPKTGYPLQAQPHWKNAGGDGDILELPLEDTSLSRNFPIEEAVDPKTGYPLQAQPHWKDAGGDGDILEVPLEDTKLSKNSPNEEAVDPKTGYPLQAQPHWKDAGGDGDILEVPLEVTKLSKNSPNEETVDPKTGYPLQAQPHWKNAGGNGDILELPLETPGEEIHKKETNSEEEYSVIAQQNWKETGGNTDVLPLKESTENNKIDKKTGYPLIAEPSWKEAGGNEEIIELPLENTMNGFMYKSELKPQQTLDPKINSFLSSSKRNGNIFGSSLSTVEKNVKVESKTEYPLIAQTEWSLAGRNGNILQFPSENFVNQIQERSKQVMDEELLTQFLPPPLESNYYTGFGSFPLSPTSFFFAQNPSLGGIDFFDNNRIPRRYSSNQNFENNRQEKVYTFTYPDDAIVSVTHFSSANNQNMQGPSVGTTDFTTFGIKQSPQSFTERKTQNFNGNFIKNLPNTPTTAYQEFKTFQPSGFKTSQFQQHQIRQFSPYLTANIARSFP